MAICCILIRLVQASTRTTLVVTVIASTNAVTLLGSKLSEVLEGLDNTTNLAKVNTTLTSGTKFGCPLNISYRSNGINGMQSVATKVDRSSGTARKFIARKLQLSTTVMLTKVLVPSLSSARLCRSC